MLQKKTTDSITVNTLGKGALGKEELVENFKWKWGFFG